MHDLMPWGFVRARTTACYPYIKKFDMNIKCYSTYVTSSYSKLTIKHTHAGWYTIRTLVNWLLTLTLVQWNPYIFYKLKIMSLQAESVNSKCRKVPSVVPRHALDTSFLMCNYSIVLESVKYTNPHNITHTNSLSEPHCCLMQIRLCVCVCVCVRARVRVHVRMRACVRVRVCLFYVCIRKTVARSKSLADVS